MHRKETLKPLPKSLTRNPVKEKDKKSRVRPERHLDESDDDTVAASPPATPLLDDSSRNPAKRIGHPVPNHGAMRDSELVEATTTLLCSRELNQAYLEDHTCTQPAEIEKVVWTL